MLGIDLEKAGKEAVDEVATKVVPALEPVLEAFATSLKAALTEVLVGRKITITIE